MHCNTQWCQWLLMLYVNYSMTTNAIILKIKYCIKYKCKFAIKNNRVCVWASASKWYKISWNLLPISVKKQILVVVVQSKYTSKLKLSVNGEMICRRSHKKWSLAVWVGSRSCLCSCEVSQSYLCKGFKVSLTRGLPRHS